jgi:hypothetical protein
MLSLSLSLSLSRARALCPCLSCARALSLSLSLSLSCSQSTQTGKLPSQGGCKPCCDIDCCLGMCSGYYYHGSSLSHAHALASARTHTQTLSRALSRWRARALSGVRALSRFCCLHALSGPVRALARISHSHDLSFSVAFSLALSSISFFVVVNNMIRYTT